MVDINRILGMRPKSREATVSSEILETVSDRTDDLYLSPAGEYVSGPYYAIHIDRGDLPPDTKEIEFTRPISPECLMSRLDSDIRRKNGVVVVHEPERSRLVEEMVDTSKWSNTSGVYLFLNYSPPVYACLEKIDFPPSDRYPIGSSSIKLMSSYLGRVGLRVKELDEIALENGLIEQD